MKITSALKFKLAVYLSRQINRLRDQFNIVKNESPFSISYSYQKGAPSSTMEKVIGLQI